MATAYPGGYDNFTNPAASDLQSSAAVPHNVQHSNANDAIEAIEQELGLNPSGDFATVAERLVSLRAAIDNVLSGGGGGSGGGMTPEVQAALLDRWTKAQAATVHAPYDHDALHRPLFYTKDEAAARFAPISILGGTGSIGFDVDGTPYVIGGGAVAPEPVEPVTNTVTAALRDWLPLWRLQLPTDLNPTNNILDEVRVPELSTYWSDYFYENAAKTGFQLWVPGDGFSSQNSQYARTELREVLSGGANAAWDTRDGRKHTFSIAAMSVLAISGTKRRLIVTQIHNGSDLVSLRLDNNGAGGLQLAFIYDNGLSPNPAPVVAAANYVLGTPFSTGYEIENGVVKCLFNGAVVTSYTDNMNRGAVHYFKCGAYLLTEPGLTSYVRAPDGVTITMPPEPADVSARVELLAKPVVSHVTVNVNEPVDGGGSGQPGVGPYAALSRFKLQLPINSDNVGNIDEILQPQLSAGYTSQFFRPTADGRGFRFYTPVTGARTSGSQFPRTELRELNADGTNAGWTPGDGKTRTFTCVYRINHLPAVDPQTTIFQIHNVDTEVLTIRADAGGIRCRKNGSSMNPYPIPSYTFGTDFTAQVRVTGGPTATVRVQINGVTAHEFPFTDLTVGPTGVFYFKAGNYLQANPTTVSDPAEYGEVELRDIVAVF